MSILVASIYTSNAGDSISSSFLNFIVFRIKGFFGISLLLSSVRNMSVDNNIVLYYSNII